jgi:serine/threonine protein phosphatase PrpC
MGVRKHNNTQAGELMKLEIDSLERPSHDTSHDRLSVLRDAHRTLIALADGKGSSQAAQTAAARTVDELARCFRSGTLPEEPQDWVMVLEAIDHVVLSDGDAGETSALVMLVHQGVVVGASVGDSLAYIVSPAGDKKLLTKRQHSQPRIGTGLAVPVGFGPTPLDGKLITRRAARFEPREAPRTAGSLRWSVPSPLLAHG